MTKEVLTTPSAPGALGPYSVAVQANGFVYLSGQVALTSDGERVGDDAAAQTGQVMDNIGAILGDLGLGYADIVKTTIFMIDMDDYPSINEIYGGYFEGAPPARSAVEVAKLPGGFVVEVEVIAVRSSGGNSASHR